MLPASGKKKSVSDLLSTPEGKTKKGKNICISDQYPLSVK